MSTPFQFTRLSGAQKLRTVDLSELMHNRQINQEKWIFVSPHDDDAFIGSGLWMQAAAQAGVSVYVMVVTDGRMGYCQMEQRESIIETRQAETAEAARIMGISEDRVVHLGYPDGGLHMLQGRRPALPGELQVKRYTGLQNIMTHHLRTIRPDRVLVPTYTDLHPDHHVTYTELMISLFHASGAIWPELGEPLSQVPTVYEMAVYCDFCTPPNLEVCCNEKIFENKLRAIAAFRSQAQIKQLVAQVRAGGPYEYLREVDFQLYSAQRYRPLFN